MSIESVMPSNHLILYRPLLLLPSIFPSIRVFSNESALCIRWPKYWSFSFNISPSNEHPRLTSFRMDWLDFLAVQVTLKSLLQHHNSKASILDCVIGERINKMLYVHAHTHTHTREYSVQFSHSVMSNSLRPHELQDARPPGPSPTPGVHSDSRPSSQWCHPTVSSSVIPFFSCLQSFPASGSFPISQFFTSGGQSIGL